MTPETGSGSPCGTPPLVTLFGRATRTGSGRNETHARRVSAAAAALLRFVVRNGGPDWTKSRTGADFPRHPVPGHGSSVRQRCLVVHNLNAFHLNAFHQGYRIRTVNRRHSRFRRSDWVEISYALALCPARSSGSTPSAPGTSLLQELPEVRNVPLDLPAGQQVRPPPLQLLRGFLTCRHQLVLAALQRR